MHNCSFIANSQTVLYTALCIGTCQTASASYRNLWKIVGSTLRNIATLDTMLDTLILQALLQVFLTAYLELVMLGGLSKGQSVLIHAGASGVG